MKFLLEKCKNVFLSPVRWCESRHWNLLHL